MKNAFSTRSVNLRKPATFDAASQSVQVVAATENPVQVWDAEKNGTINEVLMVKGASLPVGGQVPLLDSHNRSSVKNVIGSARSFQVADSNLECRVFFSDTEEGKSVAINVRDGHLTDFSVGYRPIVYHYVNPGETKVIGGRSFQGPLKVTEEWKLMELSAAIVGADHQAKARSADANGSTGAEDTSLSRAANDNAGAGARSDAGDKTDIVDWLFYAFLIYMILSLLSAV